jgi:hypothetical protein
MCSIDEVVPSGLQGLESVALLDLIEQHLAALGAHPLDAEPDDDALAESVERLHRLETMVAAEKLRRIAEVDIRQTWRAQGARSTVELLAQRLQLTRRQARAQAETAVALEGLPATAEAFRAGTIGVGHAHVAARAAKDLRPDVREALDGLVASDGAGLNQTQLRDHVDTWTQRVDPDALAERERRLWANRRVSVNRDALDGSVRGQFQLDPVGGATLIAALDAQSRKASAADERSYPQRLADALVTLAEQALDRGELPQVAAQRPHVIVLTTAETLQSSSGASVARLDGVGPVSEATARLIGCDADITPVTVERNGRCLTSAAPAETPPKPNGSRSSPETKPASVVARPRRAAKFIT